MKKTQKIDIFMISCYICIQKVIKNMMYNEHTARNVMVMYYLQTRFSNKKIYEKIRQFSLFSHVCIESKASRKHRKIILI